jgi:hypothetical protein
LAATDRKKIAASGIIGILHAVEEFPKHVAISPITLTCPKCHAKPGDVCEVLSGKKLEIVHVERIKLALEMDVAAKDRLAIGFF